MDKRDRRKVGGGSRKHERKNQQIPNHIYLLAIAFLLLVVVGMIFVIRRYTPTKEHMSLSDYFTLTEENQAAVILNGEYKEVSDSDDAIYAIATDQGVYLEISFLKSNLDDGYVYDTTEGVLRYVTDQDVVSASLNSDAYTVGKSRESLGKDVVVSQNGAYFVSADFVKLYTDMSFELFDSPNRVVIETAGYEKKVASLKRDAALRRFGGVKSKILKDAKKGDQLTILENYGKWSHVLTEDGVLACVQNRRLFKSEKQTVEATLPERTYNHITVKDPIVMGWHQVTSQSANSGVSQVVAGTGLNVISPTWFSLSDNLGNIKSLASSDYVTYCHQNNIQVWGLVSNLENKNVDTTTVLNTTSYRDSLVNNLITQAISYDLDGINVDMEALSVSAKDGYIEFIKELSIKCEKNDIILSVDNYVPSASTAFYNRSVQADYADYIAVMAYDEHYVGGDEAGSVASIGFVEKGVADTLEEVPADQIILGMPFYARVWAQSDSGLTSSAYGMEDMQSFLNRNQATSTWSEEAGQYYAEFTEGDTTYMAWIEDATSLSKKLDVMKENKLAGASFWKLGFETKDTWQTIKTYFK